MEFKGNKSRNHLYMKVFGATRLDKITAGVNVDRNENTVWSLGHLPLRVLTNRATSEMGEKSGRCGA